MLQLHIDAMHFSRLFYTSSRFSNAKTSILGGGLVSTCSVKGTYLHQNDGHRDAHTVPPPPPSLTHEGQPRMHPGVDGNSVHGGVPSGDLVLQAGHHHQVQDVVHDPAGKEGQPRLQEVDEGGAVSWGPGGQGVPQSWHPHLPDEPVIGVHAECARPREKTGSYVHTDTRLHTAPVRSV